MRWIFLVLMSVWGATAMAYEEARYEVVKADGDYTVRRYAPALVAEVALAERGADNAAFRLLFNYISGANVGAQKVAMTVPVTTAGESQKIAMTVPVTKAAEGGTVMRFFLPAQFTLATAPVPTDKRVVIKQLPAEEVAVVQFSWLGNDGRMAEKEQALRRWMKEQGLKHDGAARWVFYNAPWTLPWMRRNEVWVGL